MVSAREKKGKSMKKWIFGFLYVFLFMSSLSAYTWSITPSTTTVSFSGYTGSQKSTSKTIRVSRGTTSGTTYFYLLVASANPGQYSVGNRRLYYNSNLSDTWAQILIRRSASTTEAEVGIATDSTPKVISGTISNYSSYKNVTVYFYTGSGLLPAHTYSNTFTLELFYSSTNLVDGNGQLTGTGTTTGQFATFNVSLASTSSTSMSLGKSTIALDLAPNTAPYDTTTLSVTGGSTSIAYRIQVISAHNGNLYMDASNFVPYLFYFNNSASATDLSAGTVTLVSADKYTSKTYNIKIATDSLDMLNVGTYTDTLTFIFTTQ
jgi:hypothetical protein